MLQADLLIHSASQLVTCANPHGVKRGAALGDVGLIEDGTLLAGCKTNPPAPQKSRTEAARKAPAPAPHGPDYDGVLR